MPMVKYVPAEKIMDNWAELKRAYASGVCLRPNQLSAVKQFLLARQKDSDIAELGTGGGHTSAWLLKQGFSRIKCVDINNYLAYPELNKRFHKCDLSRDKLPFKDSSMDGIIAIEVVEHLENMVWCLKEVSRVLKPGGWFLMAIPNAANLRRRIKFLLTGDNLLVSEKNDHLQNITHSLVRKLAKEHFNDSICGSLRYPVLFPILRFKLPYMGILADNRIYLIRKH
jgi:ubiquinone/menaquinone biosynthesis C-methylase UbiE